MMKMVMVVLCTGDQRRQSGAINVMMSVFTLEFRLLSLSQTIRVVIAIAMVSIQISLLLLRSMFKLSV